jgi:hypothetical protein
MTLKQLKFDLEKQVFFVENFPDRLKITKGRVAGVEIKRYALSFITIYSVDVDNFFGLGCGGHTLSVNEEEIYSTFEECMSAAIERLDEKYLSDLKHIKEQKDEN